MAQAQILHCLDLENADSKIASLLEHFAGETDSYESRMLHFELARHYARRGTLEPAMDQAMKTLSLPWATEAFISHPDFSLIASNTDAMVRLFNAKENVELEFGLEACSEPEIL